MSNVVLEHHTLAVGDVRLHHIVAGPADGPVVLLLHGWPQTWYEWRHVVQELAADCRVIVPDIRGVGHSAKPANGYDARTIAEDLSGLLTALGVERCTVVGHDWGAAWAYVLAATHPEQVESLGIVEFVLPGVGLMEDAMALAPGGHFLWHLGFQSVPDLPELLISGKERPYLQWFFSTFAYDPTAIGPAELDVYVAAMTQVGALRAGLAVYQEFFTSAQQIAELAKTPLTIPVRAYGGVASAAGLTLASVQAVAPDAQGGVVERCGHWAAEERPDVLVALVRELQAAARLPG